MFVGLRSTTYRRQYRTRRRQWRDNSGRRRTTDSRGKTMAEFYGFILKEEEDLKAIEQYIEQEE